MGRIMPPVHLLHQAVLVTEHAFLPVHTVLLIVVEEIPAIPALECGAVISNSGTAQFFLGMGIWTLFMLMALGGVDPTLAKFVFSMPNFLVVGQWCFQASRGDSRRYEL